ncbi:MAG: hypothetical protein HYX62_09880 [Gammaproteobacteria bacterium]|nr:hypothetical protein [Gammaproteobacteria bacterium]
MKARLFARGLLVSFVLSGLVSCGGGAGGGLAGGGIGGTGVSQGPVTGFGSVFVNGIEFATERAEIEVEGQTSGITQADLGVGMVVRVEWEKDASGKYTAKRIKYADDVQGPVEGITIIPAVPSGTFTVLGQTIKVDALTVFSGTTEFAGLAGGQIVEVSGLREANGEIRATRVEVKTGTTEVELKGVVSSLNNPPGTFTIGATTVNYSGLPGGVLPSVVISGVCVEVKGTANGSGITATSIEIDDSCSLGGIKNGEEVEIEGFVTGLPGDTFSVNGVAVSVASLPDSGYENGIKTNLANNVRVEVEGKITNGVLLAQKVKFKLGGDDGASGGGSGGGGSGGSGIVFGEAKGQVTSVVPPNTLSVLDGTQPVTVTVNNDTLFEDGIQRNLGNVNTSSSLKINFYTKDGTNIATKVELENGG